MNKKYFFTGFLIVFCITFFCLQEVSARGSSTDLGGTYTTSQTCRWDRVSNKVTCYKSDADPTHQIFSGTSCPSGWSYHGPVEKNSCSNEVLCDNQNRQDYTSYRCYYISRVTAWGSCSNGIQRATRVTWSSKNGQTCSNIALHRQCGDCGPSDGKEFSSKPSTGLCNVGTSSAVTGSGPWSWTCTKNGVSDRCSATKAVVSVDGVCGTRNKSYSAATTSYPSGTTWCTKGSPSVQPRFPSPGTSSTWNCGGTNGGSTANCKATRGEASCTGGNPPAGATWCSGDTQNLTANTAWTEVGVCTNARKCEYTMPPIECTGSNPPAGAIWCVGWNTPSSRTPWVRVDSCSNAVDCDYILPCACDSGANVNYEYTAQAPEAPLCINGEPTGTTVFPAGAYGSDSLILWTCNNTAATPCSGSSGDCTAQRGSPDPCKCGSANGKTQSGSPGGNAACENGDKDNARDVSDGWTWDCGTDVAGDGPNGKCIGKVECSASCVSVEIDAPSSVYLKKGGNTVNVKVRINGNVRDDGTCTIKMGEETIPNIPLNNNVAEADFEYVGAGTTIEASCELAIDCAGGTAWTEPKTFTAEQHGINSACMQKTCNASGICQKTPVSATNYDDAQCSSTCNSNADCSRGRMIETRP